MTDSKQRNEIFDPARAYILGDEELNLIGPREKLAQWRHRNVGPAFYKMGKKVVYRGVDLNARAEAQRVEPANAA